MRLRDQLGLLIALTALAAAGRLLLLALPNVALTFFVVAVAGLAYGPRMGAAVGGLAMLLTSLALSGPTPGILLVAGVVALLGALVGSLRALRFPGPTRTLAGTLAAAALGIVIQVGFSVSVDAAGWALFAYLPGGPAAVPLLVPLLVGGLLFNIPAAAFQGALFGAALHPVLHALRAAGLAEDSAPPRARSRREVIVADLA